MHLIYLVYTGCKILAVIAAILALKMHLVCPEIRLDIKPYCQTFENRSSLVPKPPLAGLL